MSTENDNIAVDQDVSRDDVLAAIKAARSNEGIVEMPDAPEDAPAEAESDGLEEQTTEDPAEEAAEEAAEEPEAPAAAAAPPTPEEVDEVERILEEARAKRGDVAAKATEIERREKEAAERIAKMERDAEARVQKTIEEALGLLSKDPLEAARRFKVDPDKYALAKAEEEDPTAQIVSKVDKLLEARDKRIAELEARDSAREAAKQKAEEAAFQARRESLRAQYVKEVDAEKHPFIKAVWSDAQLLAETDAFVGELIEASKLTGKAANLSNAQLLERLEKKAAEVAKTKKAELQKALALLDGKPAPKTAAPAAKPKAGMTAAVAGARKTAPGASLAATEAEERALTLQKIRQLRG